MHRMVMEWAGCPYRVVKFIVKVRDIEKRVNNHVGRVIVQKAMIHSRACGRNVTSEVNA